MKLVTPDQVKVGDKIRFSSGFLKWYETIVGKATILEDDGYFTFQEVASIRIDQNCPEEYWSFFFSKVPGDCFMFAQGPDYGDFKVDFPIEIQ